MTVSDETNEAQKKNFSQKIVELKKKVFNIKKRKQELEENIHQDIDKAKAEDLLEEIQGEGNNVANK